MLRLGTVLLLSLLPAVVASAAVDARQQRVVLALETDPPTLNSLVATDLIAGFVLSHVMEGLLSHDAEGELTGGVAERWEMSGNEARFWLREEARWSDGEPVTAHDFVHAWRQVVAPETASSYAFILYPLKNAEAINHGELPVEALGVEAVSDRELRVQLEHPTPYFLSLTTFTTYFPAREDVVERWGRSYGSGHDKLLFNGPFEVTRWVHGARLTLQRNSHYWDRERIALREIDMPYVTADPGAQYNLFRDGRVALATLDSATLDDALSRGHEVRQFATGTLFFLSFNLRDGRPTANRALRRAIRAVLDPELLVNRVIGLPGIQPAYSLFPRTVGGLEGRFRDEYPPPPQRYDVAEARRWLAQAREELGVEEIPPLVLLISDTPRALREAEYYQYVLGRTLGLDIRIDAQIFKQRLDRMARGDFDLGSGGWRPDFDDPYTFGELFASWNESNRGRFEHERYDHWVRVARDSTEPQQRFAAFDRLQHIIASEVPIIPTYENAELHVQHPRLKGVRRAIFGGDPDLRHARIVEPR